MSTGMFVVLAIVVLAAVLFVLEPIPTDRASRGGVSRMLPQPSPLLSVDAVSVPNRDPPFAHNS